MADIQLANTDSDLSGNTVVTEENAYTITGLHTFSRSTNAPFACISGAAVVTYLDADKLDGQEGAYYLAAANFTGTLAVNRGGTGAATLTDGGVLLGSGTSAITAMSVLANSEMIVGNGSTDPVAESGATLRTSIGVGTGDTLQLTGIELGHATDTTLVRSSSGNVSIEGNVIYRAGGTDVAVYVGGTGACSLTDGGVLLGSGTGAITALAVLSDSEMIVGDGSGDPVAESGATLRTSIGVGTGDSPQFTGIELGHASDTTLTRASAGNVSIDGNAIYRAGGTDVPVADGGTGASTLTDGGVLLGSGTGAVTAMSVLAASEMIVGNGSTDPVAESGATLRTSVGVGTGDSPQFTGIELGHASDTTLTRASSGNVNIEGNLVYRAGGTDVPVADGGTGASSLTDGGVLLGSGTGAVTAMSVLSDGELIVGDGTGDPVAESGATLRTSVGVGTGDTPQFTALALGISPTGGDLCIDAAESSTPTIRFENDQGTVDGSIDSWTSASNIQLWIGANEYLNSGSLARFNDSYDTAAVELTAEGVINLRTGDDATSTTRLSVDKAGAVAVAGALSKGSGSFRISHPLPAKNATHELVHSFIEGPQCDLIYRGTVILVAGAATVNLDTVSNMTAGTWVLLCHGAQCFTSNETGWSSVRGSVSGNLLTIECEVATSTDTISWMVVAERQDDHILETAWTDEDGRPIVEPPVAS